MSKARPGRWAFMTRQDIPDMTYPAVTYLTRWRIIETPLFAVYLHKIRRSDHDRHLHNHPWSFVSFILRGGYSEVWSDGDYFAPSETRGLGTLGWRRIRRMGRHQFHSIVRIDGPVWSLLLIGPRSQDWGYLTMSGVIPHETYHRAKGLKENSR